MLQVRGLLSGALGEGAVILAFKLLFILTALCVILYAISRKAGFLRLLCCAAVLICAYIFSLRQPYLSEKTHVLTYGLLGYLAARDMDFTRNKTPFKNMAIAAGFVCLTSALDEGFQAVLPYRFAEFRDFMTNIISGIIGSVLFYCFPKSRSLL